MTPNPASAAIAQKGITDHSLEGITILSARPSRLFRLTLLVLCFLLVCGLVWSFIGRADVIVSAEGKLGPEAEERLVYAPLDGSLADLYVTEGTPVTEGDVIAKINSPTALQLAAQVEAARLKLRAAEDALAAYPYKRAAAEQYVKIHEFQIEKAEAAQAQREAEWLEKLAEDQRIKLDRARSKVEKTRQTMDYAHAEWQKHRRLFQSPGGGGISQATVLEKEKEYLTQRAEHDLANAELSEFEVKLKEEYNKKRTEVDGYTEALLNLYAQLAERQAALATGESNVLGQLEAAKAELASLQKIAVDDIDEANLLLVRAPVSGVVTSVNNTQPGVKLEQKTPFVSIAPADARTVLQLEIPERERGLLKEGMAVKVKFNAFPYQRYGFINGVLEYIAPAAGYSQTSTQQNPKLVFKARVRLERLSYPASGDAEEIPLRYGMTAVAEIVVRKRRLIDIALDPFRRAAG